LAHGQPSTGIENGYTLNAKRDVSNPELKVS